MRFAAGSFSLTSKFVLTCPSGHLGRRRSFQQSEVERRRLYCQGVGLAPLGRPQSIGGGRNHEQTPSIPSYYPPRSPALEGGKQEDDAGGLRGLLCPGLSIPRHRFHFRFCNSQAITQTRSFLVCPESRKSPVPPGFQVLIFICFSGGSGTDAPRDGSIFLS